MHTVHTDVYLVRALLITNIVCTHFLIIQVSLFLSPYLQADTEREREKENSYKLTLGLNIYLLLLTSIISSERIYIGDVRIQQ